MSFNLRQVTWVQNPSKRQKELGREPVRLFDIKEVYYDKEGLPVAFTDTRHPFQYDDIEDTKGILDKVKEAFNKPILDLDSVKGKKASSYILDYKP